jgi:hypothetical protein
VDRYSRIELGTALAAAALAVVAGLYLVITTVVEHETCYGIGNAHIVCHPLEGQDAAQAAARIAVTLSIVLVLYATGAWAARWQTRTRHKDARLTAYMVLVTCALTVLGLTLPALGGVGFFFLPSTLLLLAATAAGLFALLEANRDPRRNDAESE